MLRITGGEFRGRLIQAPAHNRTRPTQARLRQAMFNSLQTLIPDANVLDLFAGSGALGFEALSRGARRVTYVESDRSVVRLIQKNAETLGVQKLIKIIGEPLEGAWSRILVEGPFDVVLADPPYAGGWESKLLAGPPWGELLSPGGCLCLEWGKLKSEAESLPDEAPFLVKMREKLYGESILSTYQRK